MIADPADPVYVAEVGTDAEILAAKTAIKMVDPKYVKFNKKIALLDENVKT